MKIAVVLAASVVLAAGAQAGSFKADCIWSGRNQLTITNATEDTLPAGSVIRFTINGLSANTKTDRPLNAWQTISISTGAPNRVQCSATVVSVGKADSQPLL